MSVQRKAPNKMKLLIFLHIFAILAVSKSQISDCLNKESANIANSTYEKLLHKIFEVNRLYMTFLKKSFNYNYEQYKEKCGIVDEFSTLISNQIRILAACDKRAQLEDFVFQLVEFSKQFCKFTDKERQGKML